MRPPRVGIVGFGRMGARWAEAIRRSDRAKVTAVCTDTVDRASIAGTSVATYPRVSFDAMLQGGRVDAVIITSPATAHFEHALACLEAGVPCVIEKPMCTTTEHARVLVRAAEKAKVPVLVNHTRLFTPTYTTLRAAVHGLGEPIRVVFSEGGATGPFRSDVDVLLDWLPHDLAIALDLIGGTPNHGTLTALGPEETAGAHSRGADLALAHFRWPAGEQAWLHAGRLWPEKRTQLAVWTTKHQYVVQEGVGVAVTPFDYDHPAGHRSHDDVIPAPHGDPLDVALHRFLDAVNGHIPKRGGGPESWDLGVRLGASVVNLATWARDKTTTRGGA